MKKYYFIDESGNAEFFGKRNKRLWENEGWNPVLIMGLVEVQKRKQLRKEIEIFHTEVLKNPLFGGICSLAKDEHYFHACKDHPEVRAAFFQFLQRQSDVRCYIVVGRKNPETFINEFH